MSSFTKISSVFGFERGEEYLRNQVGKLVFAHTEVKSSRLLIRSPGDYTNAEFEDGVKNIFSLTNKEVDPGLYVCRIERLTWDSHFNPIFILLPLKPIKEEDFEHDEMKYIFMNSKCFAEFDFHIRGNYNLDELQKNLQERGYWFPEYPDYLERILNVSRTAWEAFIKGDVSVEEIIGWMNELNDAEKAERKFYAKVYNFISSLDENQERYPYLVKYFRANKSYMGKDYNEFDNNIWLARELENKYDNTVFKGFIEAISSEDIFDKAEAYLAFDAARKAQHKAEKAAAKKAKKAALKAANS